MARKGQTIMMTMPIIIRLVLMINMGISPADITDSHYRFLMEATLNIKM